MKNFIRKHWWVGAGLFFVGHVHAHSRLLLNGTTPPRNASSGLKVGPCGNVPRTSSPTVLTAGQTLKVQWEEVIDHPGYYRIAFSPAADAGFDANILAARIDDLPNVHAYETNVTVPSTPCTNCTLQLIQYMTENNPPTLYYSCADVEIRAAGSPMPSPTPRVSYSPVPLPTDCH
ncbi:MAG: lytic polysaccharide monooxygenase [Cryobacterium sp.]|nr:lytic polysaccharide monooxygenase [Oligoflexia bacterium]